MAAIKFPGCRLLVPGELGLFCLCSIDSVATELHVQALYEIYQLCRIGTCYFAVTQGFKRFMTNL
jgi:hypothetical protein